MCGVANPLECANERTVTNGDVEKFLDTAPPTPAICSLTHDTSWLILGEKKMHNRTKITQNSKASHDDNKGNKGKWG